MPRSSPSLSKLDSQVKGAKDLAAALCSKDKATKGGVLVLGEWLQHCWEKEWKISSLIKEVATECNATLDMLLSKEDLVSP